ncbi:MAG TPA: RcnB family protein [Bordetella sp.]|uniref:RcnB family protein n=1 Tax=Bordetella sp. TaxID=28081 RepID=UPI002ED1A1A5
MSRKSVISTVLTAVLAVGGSAAMAQSSHDQRSGQDHRPGPNRAAPDHRPQGHDRGHDARQDPPPGHWSRGDRVPPTYRGRQYVVNDWRDHHLHQPPRGYQWISTGADYFLIGVATGAVLESVLGH